jgi:hypothetical protein
MEGVSALVMVNIFIYHRTIFSNASIIIVRQDLQPFPHLPEIIMSKSQDAKKTTKKEPLKTPKEKQAEKKLKKEAAKRG